MDVTFLNYRGPCLDLDLYENILTEKEAKNLFDYFENKGPWNKIPSEKNRCNCNYGEKGLMYTLAFGTKKIVRSCIDWQTVPLLLKLKEKVSLLTDSTYNYCVVQRYGSGNVGIKKHRDREMAKGTVIAGVLLGQERTLTMSRWTESLYVLNPPTNDYWLHEIEKEGRDSRRGAVRISITFRSSPSFP